MILSFFQAPSKASNTPAAEVQKQGLLLPSEWRSCFWESERISEMLVLRHNFERFHPNSEGRDRLCPQKSFAQSIALPCLHVNAPMSCPDIALSAVPARGKETRPSKRIESMHNVVYYKDTSLGYVGTAHIKIAGKMQEYSSLLQKPQFRSQSEIQAEVFCIASVSSLCRFGRKSVVNPDTCGNGVLENSGFFIPFYSTGFIPRDERHRSFIKKLFQ